MQSWDDLMHPWDDLVRPEDDLMQPWDDLMPILTAVLGPLMGGPVASQKRGQMLMTMWMLDLLL